jgi:predicted CoA-binding protein
MSKYEDILRETKDIVLHNWPIEDVPNTLAEAGYSVTVYGGPQPDDIFIHEMRDGQSVVTRTGKPPEHADLVYVLPWPGYVLHEDLPRTATAAKKLGAATLWYQSGLASAGVDDPKGCWMPEDEAAQVRQIIEEVGLRYVADAYIADAVREAGIQQ